ncbi:unnamed protein product [Pleuronectes platessa]|uniref:Uncharacterized protein n=1 Tax=Pleuronectes platessa TaxID=8262 RepID=A0A9N7UI10_PLEPL|nr:unnamed protein product [Pleuronectes platessa]
MSPPGGRHSTATVKQNISAWRASQGHFAQWFAAASTELCLWHQDGTQSALSPSLPAGPGSGDASALIRTPTPPQMAKPLTLSIRLDILSHNWCPPSGSQSSAMMDTYNFLTTTHLPPQ